MTSEGRAALHSAVPSLIAAALALAGVAAFHAQVPAAWLPVAALVCAGAFALGLLRPLAGLRLAMFLVPLTGSMPLQRPTGWFPLILTVWLFLFCGWQVRRIRDRTPGLPNTPLTPMALAWIVVTMAWAAVAAARYLRFWPMSGAALVEIPANGLGDTNFGAARDVFRAAAIFLAGPGVAWMSAALHGTAGGDAERERARSLGFVVAGISAAMVYGVWQSMGHAAFGNTEHFAARGQINATFIDPNALGTSLMLTLPIAGALAYRSRSKAMRAALGATIAVSLYVLLQSGSRTGVLGVGLAVCVLGALLALRAPTRKAVLARAGAGAGAVVLAAGIGWAAFTATPARETALGRRIGETLQRAEETGLLRAVYSERYGLWYRATRVVKEWPLTGTGYGTYWTDIPNVMGIGQNEPWYRDNAASFYLQVLAETGVAGLAAAVAFLACLVAAWWRCARGGSRDTFRAIAGAGLPAMALLFATGPHTNATEVQFLFWFLAATVAVRSPGAFVWSEKWRVAAGAWCTAAAALCVLLIHASTTSLSIHAMQERGRMFFVNGGFHAPEWKEDGFVRRWTKKDSFVLLPRLTDRVWADVYCRHPGLSESDPAVFTVRAEGEEVARLAFSAEGTQRVEFDLPQSGYPSVAIEMEIDRTWIPSRHLEDNEDMRELGVLIDDFRFVLPPGFGE